MVSRIAAALPRARGVLLAGRAHHRARRLDQALERQRPALQMDQDRRPDHRPHLPLLLTHLRTGTLVPPEHTAAARQALGPDILLAPEQAVVLSADPQLSREKARAFVHDYLALPN